MDLPLMPGMTSEFNLFTNIMPSVEDIISVVRSSLLLQSFCTRLLRILEYGLLIIAVLIKMLIKLLRKKIVPELLAGYSRNLKALPLYKRGIIERTLITCKCGFEYYFVASQIKNMPLH